MSLVPLKAINQAINTKCPTDTLPQIEENPFLAIEQHVLVLMPILQRLGSQVPDTYMSALWNPGGHNLILKWNMTIGYVKELDYKEKVP